MQSLLTYGRISEVAQLTGARQRPKQIEVLTRNGIPFFVGLDGWPRVARDTISGAKRTEPDWDAMEGRGQ